MFAASLDNASCSLATLTSLGLETSDHYAALIRYCRDNTLVEAGNQVHDKLVKSSYSKDRYLNNLLIEMYGKCNNLKAARAVFNKMERKNAFSWTIIISATNAIELFERMLLEGMKPRDSFVYTSLLGGCARMGCSGLADGLKIHSLVLLQYNIFSSDSVVGTALINMYGKCGYVQGAKSVFEWMENRNLSSWNALLHAYARNGDFDSAFSTFYVMLQAGMRPDSVTLIGILEVFSAAGAEAAGRVFHETFIDCEYITWSDDVILKTALVHMYVNFGDLHCARQVFDRMNCRSSVSWNVMITGYAQAGYTTQGMELSWRMEQEGWKPDDFTFTTLLGMCSEAGARHALQERIISSSCWSLPVFNAMLTMHGRLGDLDSLDFLFQLMPEKDEVSWNAAITAYTQTGHHGRCFKAYERMNLEGMKPNRITFISIVEACRTRREVKLINSHISYSRLESDTMVGTALINVYSRLGNLAEAREVFLKLKDRNEVSWTAILVAHAQHQVGGVSELYSAMNLEGVRPNHVTFIGILFSCSHRGVWDEGLRFYQSMVDDHAIQPLPDHIVCMLDLLTKVGLLTDVEECLQSNMVPRSKILLNSLFSGCKLQGDVKTGKRAVSQIFSSIYLEIQAKSC